MALSLNFASFQKELDKEIEQNRALVEANAKEVILTTYTEIMRESPVDTGFFRANNYLTYNGRTNQVLEDDPVKIKDFYTPTGNDLLNVVTDTLNGKDIYRVKSIAIQNNLPYAEVLENGHSKQTPRGIYGVAYEKVKSEIARLKRTSV